ncbi:MAG: virulence RhuM family protein [Polyangiaceae bacterium]|nr:virulence RhuM family protein [Polyangiaceae bacterium]
MGVPAIIKHLKNIFDSGELDPFATTSKMEVVQREGGRDVTRTVDFYNLDAVIAVDLAENRARRGILMKMADWASFLTRFLRLSDYPVLADKGCTSALEAKLKAEAEYEVFRVRQDREFVSDFDRVVAESKRLAAKSNEPTAPLAPKRKKNP